MCFRYRRRIVEALHRSCCEVDRVDGTVCVTALPASFFLIISMLLRRSLCSRTACIPRGNPALVRRTRHRTWNPAWDPISGVEVHTEFGFPYVAGTGLKAAWNSRSRMGPLSTARGQGSSVRSRTWAPGTRCGIMDVVLWPTFHAGCTDRAPGFWTGSGSSRGISASWGN